MALTWTQANRPRPLPDAPGVYLFKEGGTILYIGKATSLRSRVRSYFGAGLIETRGPALVDMLAKADRVDFLRTGSVLEALLLENELIRKHRPFYNVKEKDDKSFNCVVITEEKFPRVLLVRKKDLESGAALGRIGSRIRRSFGPFPHGAELTAALRIIRKIFPFRDRCRPGKGRPCFHRELGLCPGVCTGEITAAEYGKTIRRLILVFSGKMGSLLGRLAREMREAAARQEFERAGERKREIFALMHINDVALIRGAARERAANGAPSVRIEAYDAAHLGGKEAVGVFAVIEGGQPSKSEYRRFAIRGKATKDDLASLREILSRRLRHAEWPYPSFIAVDGGRAQKEAAEAVLRSEGFSWPVVAVVKDERHRPKDLLGDEALIGKFRESIILGNAEAHRFAVRYHREKREGR